MQLKKYDNCKRYKIPYGGKNTEIKEHGTNHRID